MSRYASGCRYTSRALTIAPAFLQKETSLAWCFQAVHGELFDFESTIHHLACDSFRGNRLPVSRCARWLAELERTISRAGRNGCRHLESLTGNGSAGRRHIQGSGHGVAGHR